ncbi:alpha-1,3/1,6-mannosyltransferase ALG2 [Cladochytrium replicatum]|nr:alpha-1,3/1,6-mannosyltransferase ALG2 [Cladochytrium replicatum]
MAETKRKIAFVHPDLGIGGAERLVVDAAIGLRNRGNEVTIYTSHYDPAHAFEETRNGALKVVVRGDWIPRSIGGKAHVLFAILRNIYLVLTIVLSHFIFETSFDVFFVDQISAGNFLLRLTSSKILFYCHFPDKLLTRRESWAKYLYRLPFDFLEEWTTRMADEIVVNSKFTATTFKEVFPLVSSYPQVLYPGINLTSYEVPVDFDDPKVKLLQTSRKFVVSINRFERKKNINLAIQAFNKLRARSPAYKDLFLVVAGGYDERVRENVEHHKELDALARGSGLTVFTIDSSSPPKGPVPEVDVLFVLTFTEAQRTYLLETACALLYTPKDEHFGIAPIEALYHRLPVVALNSGGPKETLGLALSGVTVDTKRGADAFADGIERMLTLPESQKKTMVDRGRSAVEEKFSSKAFGDALEVIVNRLADGETNGEGSYTFKLTLGLIFQVVCIAIYVKFTYY